MLTHIRGERYLAYCRVAPTTGLGQHVRYSRLEPNLPQSWECHVLCICNLQWPATMRGTCIDQICLILQYEMYAFEVIRDMVGSRTRTFRRTARVGSLSWLPAGLERECREPYRACRRMKS